jgi:Ca2+-binding RTX toxin-like protein
VLSGGAGNDTQSGGTGNDTIFANVGADTTDGGNGDDVLYALALADVPLAGADRVSGGAGNDTIRVRDGEPDEVSCGEGVDRAVLDRVDVIVDAVVDGNGSCEIVDRQDPRPGDSRAEDRVQSPREDAREKP